MVEGSVVTGFLLPVFISLVVPVVVFAALVLLKVFLEFWLLEPVPDACVKVPPLFSLAMAFS